MEKVGAVRPFHQPNKTKGKDGKEGTGRMGRWKRWKRWTSWEIDEKRKKRRGGVSISTPPRSKATLNVDGYGYLPVPRSPSSGTARQGCIALHCIHPLRRALIPFDQEIALPYLTGYSLSPTPLP